MTVMPQTSGALSVAVDPVALVVTECITVTSAMRKHARWAHSSVSAILGGGVASAKAVTDSARQSFSEPREKDSKDVSINITDDSTLASRWGLRGKRGQSMQDNPLLSAFARLRSNLKGCKDIHTIEAPVILHPFLQIIRSSSTSAPITSLALIAITKFFAYNIISEDSLQLPLAMQLLSSAVTNCRFEASDSSTDEIVLFRILKLMEVMIIGVGGKVLGDESMCEMMETGISMCCQVRLSELLRRSAEVSMVTMCQTIFRRLNVLEIEEDQELLPGRRNSSKSEADAVRMDPSITGDLTIGNENDIDEDRSSESLDQPRDKGGTSTEPTLVNASSQRQSIQSPRGAQSQDIKPYSLPSIRELFRVLVNLLDPHEKQHNDTMRVMALRIVDVALEVAGPAIANQPSLATLAKDSLCRHLCQLVRSENIAILNESLRVAGTLLSTCRKVLKLQQELFLSYLVACLHPRVEIPQEPGIDPMLYDGVPQAPRLVKPLPSQSSSGRSTPVPVKDRQKLGMEGGMRKPDAREAMVESVGALVRIPSFMAELFVNYDCEIDRSDLCVDMVGLLCRNAFPDAATWSTTNVPPLCLDALLGYVHSIAERLKDEPTTEDLPSRDILQEQRMRKKIIIKGATKFNENPRAGIAFLASQKIIENPDDPKAIAKFLKGTTRLDKRVLGDYISKRSNEPLLTAFLETFDFAGLRVDEALRQLLNAFRLPGEAPLIERIVNEFSARYFASAEPDNIADKDALFVFTYAIIMLNTDQHNPNVKHQNRMTFNQFARNLGGVNGGKDFDTAYLENIYDSIKTHEIVLPEEHDNKNSFDHAWKELLMKIQSTSNLTICETNAYDADMFAATWKPVIATLTYVFMSATDDTVFSRVVTGFDQCAQIAAKYDLHEALDHAVLCLSSVSSLAHSTLPSTALNTEVQAGDKKIMVSETAVRFGRDFKAQLATVVLFRVVLGQEAAIRDGWNQLVSILLNLFVNSLITKSYASISSNTDVPPIPLQSPLQVVDRSVKAPEGGLFSALSSYVSSFANDEPPEPSDQEIEYTLCTIDCVNACELEEFFSNISQLPTQALKSFVSTLLSRLPEDSTPQVIVVKPELPAPTPVRPNGQKPRSAAAAYDAGVLFVLEFATILAARDESTIAELGKEVADALQSVVRNAAQVHHITLSRAIYYLLSFLRASHEHDFIRAPVVLHTISKFDEDILKQSALFILKGLQICLSGPAGLRNEIVNSPDFWLVLKALQSIPEMAQDVFDVVEDVVEGPKAALTADNYEFAVPLLGDFATAGSVGAASEQRRDEAARRGRSPTKAKKSRSVEVVARGTRALHIIYQIALRVPSFIQQSHLEPHEAWTAYWTPPFNVLTTQSLNPCRQIRSQALSSLQRILLSPNLAATSTSPSHSNSSLDTARALALFSDVLFPLISHLLKPEVWHSDPVGMPETRSTAALLCCKVFLRYLDTLLDPAVEEAQPATRLRTMGGDSAVEGTGLPDDEEVLTGVRLWERILEMLERLAKSGAIPGGTTAPSEYGGSLDEAVPESIKNIVLVMANGGYLAPPGGAGGGAEAKKLWEVTVVKLERFLPGLVEEVFPVPEGVEKTDGAAVVEVGDSTAEAAQRQVEAAQVQSPSTTEDETKAVAAPS